MPAISIHPVQNLVLAGSRRPPTIAAVAGSRPASLARCFRCDLTRPEELFAVTVSRSYHDPALGRSRSRTLGATRLCRACVVELLRIRRPSRQSHRLQAVPGGQRR